MKKVLKNKYYTHIDRKKNSKDYEKRVRNPQWVIKHGFYPFIHFSIVFKKYVNDKEKGKQKVIKTRDIYYSAHVDRFIYEYYGDRLNNQYNEYAKQVGINNAVIAYRNNKHGLNNIKFAKEVFEYIAETNRSYVFIADFSSFFDTLDHLYLKEKIQEVKKVNRLPENDYKIFRNITKYTYVERDDILKSKNIKMKESKQLDKFFETKDFREFKKKYLKKNKNNYGIPQGSSISSVYANIYMIDFDEKVNNYVTSMGGIYRRYCDDIIICIPINEKVKSVCELSQIKKFIMSCKEQVPQLIINDDKTEEYIFMNSKFVNKLQQSTYINYLGFRYDGKVVRIREKSLFKYYCRAYKKVKSVNVKSGADKIAARKALYVSYTHLGDRKHSLGKRDENGKIIRGNFISYARESHEIFSRSILLKSEINEQIKRHWKRINDRLEK